MRVEIREKPWDLLIIVVLTFLLSTIIIVAPYNLLRIALGLPFIFFLPGYVITSALFPKDRALDGIERVALSTVLSIGIVSLIGLLLNYTPWGIRLYPVLVSLSTLIIGVSLVAWYIRTHTPLEERYSIVFSVEQPAGKVFAIVLIIALASAAMLAYYITTNPKGGEKFTEFYVLDLNGTTENYPKNLTIGENEGVIIGVICHEYDSTTYTLVVRLSDNTTENTPNIYTTDWSDMFVLNDTFSVVRNITIEHDEKWEDVFNFNIAEAGRYTLEFLLYKNINLEPYRELVLWVTIST